jgi:ABC-2 type transport system ATP-binding protein
MIETRNLSKRYENDFVALDGLTLRIEAGEVFGYIGPNGAGKTTTIRILCGLLLPSEGSARVDGKEVTQNLQHIRAVTGYMPDSFGVYEEMRVWEYLDFFGACFKIPRPKRKKRIDEVLAITRAEAMRDYFVDTLSRGMRQRVGLAKTLLHDPKAVFLDEPANGLDPRARIDMRHLIRDLAQMGKTVLVSSHILPELASVCDKVGILERGRMLAFGSVEQIMRKIQPNRLVQMQFLGEGAPVKKLADFLASKGHIHRPELLDDILQFEFSGTERDVARIHRWFLQQKVAVVWFREVEADLEEAFMKVTDSAAAAGARAGAAAPAAQTKEAAPRKKAAPRRGGKG